MSTRIYQAIPLSVGSVIQLDESATHHLARVLRASVNDAVIIFNGQGGEYSGVITRIDKKSVTVSIHEHATRDAESPLNIWLAQGISRGEKMDYTIQKAVELGVKKIIPLFTERCNVKLDNERSEKRLLHWQSIVVSACEQSGRNRIPEILQPQSLDAWLETVQADYCFVLSPHTDQKLKTLAVPQQASVVLLIGPEGGLSEREIERARLRNFLPLNLGPRILRTETAAVAAITSLQCCFGDMI
ncbi:MAG: 16S rRNA (uracil(1498)-N(3))-methyltransferase [Gammaproteobacteria bacterium]